MWIGVRGSPNATFGSYQLLFSCKFMLELVGFPQRWPGGQRAMWSYVTFVCACLAESIRLWPGGSSIALWQRLLIQGIVCHSVLNNICAKKTMQSFKWDKAMHQRLNEISDLRQNWMSGSAREALTGPGPCPCTSGTMAWMTTERDGSFLDKCS